MSSDDLKQADDALQRILEVVPGQDRMRLMEDAAAVHAGLLWASRALPLLERTLVELDDVLTDDTTLEADIQRLL
jgi:hypothetical protein